LKRQNPTLLVKADAKVIENILSAEQVKAHAKLLGKSDVRGKLCWSDLQPEFMQINRNHASITDLDEKFSTFLEIKTEVDCKLSMKQTREGAGVDIDLGDPPRTFQ